MYSCYKIKINYNNHGAIILLVDLRLGHFSTKYKTSNTKYRTSNTKYKTSNTK